MANLTAPYADVMGERLKYRAFISYSRVDGKAAASIHAALDRYRAPRDVAGTTGAHGVIPSKLHPIFMDRTDLAVGGTVSTRLEAVLKDSEALVVLCSPAAVASEWVDREVATFLGLNRGDRIFPVIIPGLPNSENVEHDYFPPALRGRGILAADFREIHLPGGKVIGDGRHGGRMKLLAGLLGVDLDQLRRRELQRAQAAAIRNGAFAVGASLLFVLAAIGGIAAFVSAITAEDRANAAQIAESSFLSERALERLANGDGAAALRDARRALPQSLSKPDRPFLSASQDALGAALIENREVARFNHDKAVGAAAFLGDGRTVLTSEIGGRVQSWDPTTGRKIQTWNNIYTGNPAPLVPIGDLGAAVATSDGQIAVLIAGSTDVRRISTGASKPRKLLAAGEILLAICDDDTVHAWRWRDGATLSQASSVDVVRNSLALSIDGQVAAYVHEKPSGEFEVVVASPIALQQPIFAAASDRVFSLALSRDGKQLAYGTGFDVVTVDLASGKKNVLSGGHAAFVLDIQFNAAGDNLISAGGDGRARIWQNQPDGEEADLVGHEGLIPSAVLAGDGRFAATLGRDRTLRLWPIDGSPRPAPIVLRGHTSAIRTLTLSADETLLLTASDDTTARMWRVSNPALRSIAKAPTALTPLAWSERYQTILALTSDLRVIEVDLTAVGARPPRTFDGVSIPGPEFTVRPAGLVSSNGIGGIVINDQANAWRPGIKALEPITIPNGTILQMQSAKSSDTIAILARDRSIWVRQGGAAKAVQAVDGGHFAAISPDGEILAIGQDDEVVIVDAATDKTIATVATPDAEGVVFSSDGTVAVAFSNTRSVLFAPKTGAVLEDFGRPAVTAAIDPAGDVVVGISGAGVVWTWSKASGLSDSATETRQPAPQAVALSPDGRLAAISQADGVIRLWATDSATLIGRIDTEGRGARDLVFADRRKILGLSDKGDRMEWELPAPCEEMLKAADRALGALGAPDADVRSGAKPQSNLYLRYVRPLVLPFVSQPGERCVSDQSSR